MNVIIKKSVLFGAIILLSIAGYTIFYFIPTHEDQKRNTVFGHQLVTNKETYQLHSDLFIADLHADTLLWNRNLNKANQYGHIDIPRLLHGNVGLQVFSVVTKTPRNLNLVSNESNTDNITLLAIAQRWPINTWQSPLNRAIYQANKLHKAASDSNGKLRIIRSKTDLLKLLDERGKNDKVIGAILSLEGGHALERKIENVDLLYELGFRIIGFTHFFDNELGGSAHGINKNGITRFGLEVLNRMEELGILIDISHASRSLIIDILKYAKKPIISTHTGVHGICKKGHRNLTDNTIQEIAKRGGLIGVGFWPTATCSQDISGIVKTIRYIVNLVGVEHIALGSDFDGNVQTPFDASGLVSLTHALRKEQFTDNQITRIMGGNVRNLLQNNLPQ